MNLSALEIRMAVSAISRGIEAIWNDTEFVYNGKEMSATDALKRGGATTGRDIAADVLYEIFNCCPMDCKVALDEMAKDKSLNLRGQKMPLFNRFVKELSIRLGGEEHGQAGLRLIEKVEIF
ncbi:MAG: hypothetical protein FWD98_07180 [Defluviitaleaceae bacterium]|nr:hypothetical protein [Defluviitaleaceae bacterium]